MTIENLAETIINTVKNLNLQSDDINDYLDYRDSQDFDSHWIQAFNDLENHDFPDEFIYQITEIREQVFKDIYKSTQSSELASYLSDDIELIMKSEFFNSQHAFVEKLAQDYLDKKLPK